MNQSPLKQRRIAFALLCVSVLLGGYLRFSRLEKRSISHPEMYVPGIPLPDGASEPAERMTFTRILTGTFSSDTHPPGYYLLMLPWTRAMGVSLRAIRFPSALLGLACIPLVYWLGTLAGFRLSGAVAAIFLAASGYHVFWSQVARMFALACFLGLASSVLLLLIHRGSRNRPILIAGYVVCILAGIATHVFFWSLFGIQMIWTFANARSAPALPAICRAQLLAFVLGSPFLAFAAYQSGNAVAELSNNVLRYLAVFLPFAFILPTGDSGFFPAAVPFTGDALSWMLRGAMLLLALFLLGRAFRVLWQFKAGESAPAEIPPPATNVLWRTGLMAAAAIATVEIVAFLYLARHLPAEMLHSTIELTKALVILPFLLAAGAFALDFAWPRLPAPWNWERFLKGERSFLGFMAVGPFLMLALFAQLRPILNQRGMLFLAPYLLLLLAIGLLSLRLPQIAVLAPALACLFVASLVSYSRMGVDPADYARFAGIMESEIGPADLVFIRKAWYETPILYYLQKDKYRLVGGNYAASCTAHPTADVWVVLLYDSDPTSDMQAALSTYTPVKTITGSHAKAILYRHSKIVAERAGRESQTLEKQPIL
jgi:uncharacterized membrane protein